MTGDLFINEKDAYTIFGVNMGEGFLESLLTPAPMKPFVENKSRMADGTRVLASAPRVDERELQLTIMLAGSSKADFLSKYALFMQELQLGFINIRVPALNTTYKLIYIESPARVTGRKLDYCLIVLKFKEPNPKDR